MSEHHFLLNQQVAQEFSDVVQEARLTQDAWILNLRNGVVLTAHIAAPDAYSLTWAYEGQLFRIDTAPLHPELATTPNHLHRPDGRVTADPLTQCGAPLWHNLSKVLEVIAVDPLLQGL